VEEFQKNFKVWCNDTYFDEETRNELNGLKDEDEIRDRFERELIFGGIGLRGVIGSGTNRMNIYTIRKVTQGLANLVIEEMGERKGVAIGYDCRKKSQIFAKEAALCLSANGIKTYLFDSMRPASELSFAVRKLKCIAGIVIAAGHTPPEYNGYKIYWEDGGQMTGIRDVQIVDELDWVSDYRSVKTLPEAVARQKGFLHSIGSQIDNCYVKELQKLVIRPEVIKEMGHDVKIVYTPLHGTGNILARRVLKELGFQNVYVVPEQEEPDEKFSTVKHPNPEEPSVYEKALELAAEVDADIVLATDSDAQRFGIYAKDSKTNEYHSFTGNMSGILICEYLLSQRREKGILSKQGALIKTIVTTNMADAVADEYYLKLIETLTGFKYIGEQIKILEEEKKYTYEFGFEESYGCLVGTHARDKDAIAAVMTLCEACAYYKKQGKSLWDQMNYIYEKYGYFKEDLAIRIFNGSEGEEEKERLVEKIRKKPLKTVAGYDVVHIRDYKSGKIKDAGAVVESDTGLPRSNILYYKLSNDAWFCIRPSGTEPKIKVYLGVKGADLQNADERLKCLKAEILEILS